MRHTLARAAAGGLLASLLASVAGPTEEPAPAPGGFAVIVHPEVPVEGLSMGELRRVFLGDRQFWTQRLRVTLLVPPPRSPARAALLERIYQKTEAQYRHHWIAKVFRTEATAAPKVIPSADLTGRLVREIEGAITVVDAGRVPEGVKVLKLDGRRPGDEGYLLR